MQINGWGFSCSNSALWQESFFHSDQIRVPIKLWCMLDKSRTKVDGNPERQGIGKSFISYGLAS